MKHLATHRQQRKDNKLLSGKQFGGKMEKGKWEMENSVDADECILNDNGNCHYIYKNNYNNYKIFIIIKEKYCRIMTIEPHPVFVGQVLTRLTVVVLGQDKKCGYNLNGGQKLFRSDCSN